MILELLEKYWHEILKIGEEAEQRLAEIQEAEKMGYRKLVIYGNTFEYVIGKSHVHVKLPQGGSLDARREEVGQLVPDSFDDVAVTPADVRAFIMRKVNFE